LDAEEIALKNLMKQAESLWITDKFVDRPMTVIFIGFCIIGLFSAICIGLLSFWPSPVTSRDVLDYTEINTQFFDTREAAMVEI
jgi:hypothetical protein